MTELVWDGKRQPPLRIALPFQTIETVNESATDRDRRLELFIAGRETEWRNRLIWRDKKYVLPSLLPEFAGKVHLIYIDPPFDTFGLGAKGRRKLVQRPGFVSYLERGDRTGAFSALTFLNLAIN